MVSESSRNTRGARQSGPGADEVLSFSSFFRTNQKLNYKLASLSEPTRARLVLALQYTSRSKTNMTGHSQGQLVGHSQDQLFSISKIFNFKF